MERILVLLIGAFGFCQVEWNADIVDSMIYSSNEFDFTHTSMAMDQNEVVHIVYNKYDEMICASKTDTSWQKETVESGFYYACFSLAFERNGVAHLGFYRVDDSLNMTYLCHAQRDTAGWTVSVVDSIYGILTNYWFLWGYYRTSIALDTSDLSGIAYTSWNAGDSLHYIKYAHYNELGWDTSLVEYDSVWMPHTNPSDWSPVLQFTGENVPMIAFHQTLGNPQDTIKIASFDTSLDTWIIEPAICGAYGGAAISFALNSQDYPCLAHGWGSAVAYSWWDGVSWHTEATGATMGWVGIRIALALDSLDNPHILYRMDFGPIGYCYKRNNVWYTNGWVETADGNFSLLLDSNGDPHISFYFWEWDSINQIYIEGIKYAKGTLVGVTEKQIPRTDLRLSILDINPNPFCTKTHIYYDIAVQTSVEIVVYDVSGRQVKTLLSGEHAPGCYSTVWDGTDDIGRTLPSGIYFIKLEAGNHCAQNKILLIK